MDKTERFYKIDQLLNQYKVVKTETFLSELQVSLATFKRDLTYMRDRLYAPISWDRDAQGYRYEATDKFAPAFAMPGLWFNSDEAYALLAMQKLLTNLEPGLLNPHIAPLQSRLNALVGAGDHTIEEVDKRIKILNAAKRKIEVGHFSTIASATLKRKRIKVTHFNRGNNQVSERTLSPLQLVHYRDNWYLDAYCHLREGLRSFSLDAISKVDILEDRAVEVTQEELKDTLEAGYGIFAGKTVKWATLKFNAEKANWVSNEVWHPEQSSRYEADGSYVLQIPYSDDRELLMDILKYADGVEVVEPEDLRGNLIGLLDAAKKQYIS